MAKLKEVKVTIGRLVNLGNYENMRCDTEATVTVGNGTEEEAWDMAYKQAEHNLKTRIPRAIGSLVREQKPFTGERGADTTGKRPTKKRRSQG